MMRYRPSAMDTERRFIELETRYAHLERQVAELRKIISRRPQGNLVLVTHGSTILALTGRDLTIALMVLAADNGLASFFAAEALQRFEKSS